EEQERGASAEPVARAAVDEDQGAGGRAARAPGAMPRRPAAPFGWQPQAPAEAPDRAPADGQPVHLAQLLGAVAVIEVPVGGLDEGDHAGPERRVQPPRGGSAT